MSAITATAPMGSPSNPNPHMTTPPIGSPCARTARPVHAPDGTIVHKDRDQERCEVVKIPLTTYAAARPGPLSSHNVRRRTRGTSVEPDSAPRLDAADAARRVAREVRTLVSELNVLRSENEALRAEHRELLQALTVITTPHGGRPLPRRARQGRGDQRARGVATAVGRRSTEELSAARGPRQPEEVVGLLLEPESRTVSWSERKVSLTPREFALLSYLLDHRGQPLKRQTVLRAVFPTSSDDPRSLRVHIQAIRAKLERLGHVPVRIATLHRVGYRLDHLHEDGP
jgi:hypothetical protein